MGNSAENDQRDIERFHEEMVQTETVVAGDSGDLTNPEKSMELLYDLNKNKTEKEDEEENPPNPDCYGDEVMDPYPWDKPLEKEESKNLTS